MCGCSTAVDVVHDKIDLVGALEGEVELDDEGRRQPDHDGLLGHGVLHALALQHAGLVQHLHGVDLPRRLQPHLQHLLLCSGWSELQFQCNEI